MHISRETGLVKIGIEAFVLLVFNSIAHYIKRPLVFIKNSDLVSDTFLNIGTSRFFERPTSFFRCWSHCRSSLKILNDIMGAHLLKKQSAFVPTAACPIVSCSWPAVISEEENTSNGGNILYKSVYWF